MAKGEANAMNIVDVARRHFGPRWKSDIRVIGRDQLKFKLAELQKEITQLQKSCERLRLADQREPKRGVADGSDIRVISERVEAEIATLHGWTVSLVETLFILVSLEMGTDEEEALRKEWRLHL
jgi:hypothetical protein